MTAKKAAAPKTRRPTTTTLILARKARDSAWNAYLYAQQAVELLTDADARTGKPDPHLRRRRRSTPV